MHHASSLRFSNNKDQSQSIKKIPSDWLIFEELSRTGPNYNIKSVTNVSTATIVLFIDTNNFNCTLSPNKHDPRSKAELTLNNWIEFESNSQDIKALIDLRDKFNILVTKKIICPQKNLGADDEYLVNFIASILTREDNSVGLIQPPGIGQRPRTFLINNYPMVNDILKEANKKSKPKQINRTIPEILKFKPISSSTYNQYLPHFVNTKLDSEQSATSEFSTNITHPICTNVMYNMSPQPYFSSMNNVHTDVTYLSQNMLMMNLYNPSKPETFANYSPCQVTVHANQSNQQEVNDFESNGVDVNDEDCEGACALSNGQIAHQCLTNWFYNCDPSQTSYFIIKAGGLKSIDISISKKTWIFSPQTERKLLRLLQVIIAHILYCVETVIN